MRASYHPPQSISKYFVPQNVVCNSKGVGAELYHLSASMPGRCPFVGSVVGLCPSVGQTLCRRGSIHTSEGLSWRLYNRKPAFGDKLLGYSIGRGLGAPKGLIQCRSYPWSPVLLKVYSGGTPTTVAVCTSHQRRHYTGHRHYWAQYRKMVLV